MLFHSILITEASGRIGGLVASHNRGGQYFRAAVMPVNPGTPQQEIIRSITSQLAIAWTNTLTEGEREAWRTYSQNVPVVNRLGDSRRLTGMNMYIRSNTARIQAGLDRIDVAPVGYDLGDFTYPTITVSEAAQQLSIAFNAGDAWNNEDEAAMLVYASRPKAASINYFKGPYRLAGAILGSTGTPLTTPQVMAVPFACAEGHRVFFRVAVCRADARYSESFRNWLSVAA